MTTYYLRYFSFIFFALYCGVVSAQQKNLPLSHSWIWMIEKELYVSDSNSSHSTFRPLIESKSSSFFHYQQLNQSIIRRKENLYRRKMHKENFIILKDSAYDACITIDPLFQLEVGKDLVDTVNSFLYKNTRGLLVQGDIGKKFSFATSFYENQSFLPRYLQAFADSLGVIPGQGRPKTFKKGGYDYAYASGYISYAPISFLHLQAGHGKHFIGDGYRSLLLSDNAFNYPFLRIVLKLKKIEYTQLYASLMNRPDGSFITPIHTEALWQKKSASFQLLSWKPFSYLEVALFQGMIWQAADQHNRQCLNLFYLNPVIGTSALYYGLHHTNNVLLGTTFNVRPHQKAVVYGQAMLDDFSRNNGNAMSKKIGFQLGLKTFELFNVKKLFLRFEYNQASPYSYAARQAQQAYMHYNQPLAHPLGAGFGELIGQINYRIHNLQLEWKCNYARYGADSMGFYNGHNPARSDLETHNAYPASFTWMQGPPVRLIFNDVRISWLINSSTNFMLYGGCTQRFIEENNSRNETNFFYLGIMTALNNFYVDH